MKNTLLPWFCLWFITFSASVSAQMTNSFPSNGNVGVGTTNPFSSLEGQANGFEIFSGTAVGPDYALYMGVDTTNHLSYIQSVNWGVTASSLALNARGGMVGIGTPSPYATLHISSNGAALGNHGLMLGQIGNAGNTTVGIGGETARFEIAFPTYRDIEPNQIGAKIAAIRWNNWLANNPLVQAIDLAFFTSTGNDLRDTTGLVDTSSEKMRITAGGNVGIGTTAPGYKLDVVGQIHASGGIVFPDGSTQTTGFNSTLCGGDYAESVDVSGDRRQYGPGDVLVIDPDAPGKFLKSAEPYSTAVLGVYSTKPGVLGRRQITPKSEDEVPMAMVGIVPTKVSAENGAIRPGDLLVTASTLGYAMKGTDRLRMLGAVIGKALGNLDSGTGTIEVGITLQ
jgi:hypothetical protein